MANVMRYRYGDMKPVTCAVDSATVIEIGDMVWLDTDDAKPFSAVADAGTKAQNQEAAHDKFLGVAMQQSRAGDILPVLVATAGVFEMDCASASLQLGTLVGPIGTGASDAVGVANQSVESVATANLAVGRVAAATASATKVKVDIVSTAMYGGPMTMA